MNPLSIIQSSLHTHAIIYVVLINKDKYYHQIAYHFYIMNHNDVRLNGVGCSTLSPLFSFVLGLDI